MHPKTQLHHLLLGLLLSLVGTLSAQVPGLINYQGRVAVGGVNFDGSGQFKFALVNADATFTHWSNDGTFGGEPAAAVTIPVVKGLYSVLLGDTSLTNMQSIPSFAFQNEDVRLRVWFNDGTHGFQQLTPDQRIAAAGYAMMAANVPDGSINQFKLAPGAVTGSAIAPFSIDANHLQNGAVTADKIAAGSVTRDAIADGAVSGAKISDGAVNTRQIAAAAIGGESWIPTPNPEDGPVGRYDHSVVWTGTEFIIWGGRANVFGGPAVSNTGARFNPSTGVWTNITLTGAPTARRGHTAVWTGTEMIVWGGTTDLEGATGGLNSGGRYNPATNTWTNTGGGFGVPPGRRNHTAVWTGTDMIIWGGQDAAGNLLGDGSKLSGATNFWSGIAVEDSPEVRHSHSAIWTGSKMVIWGGIGPSGPVNTGNVYDSAFDVWGSTQMSLPGAPDGRYGHSVIWTGTDMIVWGGRGADEQPVPGGMSVHRQNGGRYRVATNSWHPMSTTGSGGSAHRANHTAVWTGNEMLVWGGDTSTNFGPGTGGAGFLGNGTAYDPGTDTWRLMATEGEPSPRTEHTAVWTGREMIVWGSNGMVNTGGRYRLSVIADGAVGTRQLADGAVGSGQIAAGAVQSGNLANGAVGAPQLASGAVGTAQLADGAVQSSKLANGAVGSSQLGDYSVTVNHLSLGTRTGDLTDGTLSTPDADGIVDFTADFEPPFSSAPTVTMTSSQWKIGVTTSSGFTASGPGRFTDSIATTLTSYVLGESAAAIVQGRPAIAFGVSFFGEGDVWYQRASNAEGTSWDLPVRIHTGVGTVISMKIIGGHPAVLIYSGTVCKFVRATDATGTAWAPPVSVPGIQPANSPALAEVGGKPAVAALAFPPYYGVQDINYTTSSDVEGTTWGTLQTAVPGPATASTVISSVRLIEAAGRPAISFVRAQYQAGGIQELFYVRANNGIGSAWPTPSLVYELGPLSVPGYASTTQERDVEMAIIDGNPALASVAVEGGTTDKVIYLRSTTPEGTAWQTASFTAGEPYTQMRIHQLGVIAGLPMITYSVRGESAPRYVRLASATDFGPISPYTRFVRCNGSEDLLELSGKPASVFAAGEDLIVRTLDSSVPPSRWTASDGTIAPLIAATVQPGAIGSTHLADGAVGSTQLAAGAVTTTQLASGAVQGLNIASGAVGSTQLAAGAVTNTQLAAGSVQAANIAPGAINFSALAKAPQAGVVNSIGIDLQFGQGEFTVTFPQPYTSTPVVTVSLNSADSDINSSSVSIQSISSTGFSGRVQTSPLVIANLADEPGITSDRFAYADQFLIYGTTDALHAKYAPNLLVDGSNQTDAIDSGSSFAYPSAASMGVEAAVAYYDEYNKDLKFVRSSALASGWNTPIILDSTGDVGRYAAVQIVDGNPAVAYYDWTNSQLKYIRSSNEGYDWNPPVVVSNAGSEGEFCRLLVVNGRPAIAYYRSDDQSLRYVRANDATGSSWGTPVVVDNVDDPGEHCSMAIINGRPAISCYVASGNDIAYYRASDTNGTAWQPRVIVGDAGSSDGATSLEIVNGYPAIAYHYNRSAFDADEVRYVRALNVSGTAWGSEITLRTGLIGRGLRLLPQSNDEPVFLFYNSASGRIEVLGSGVDPSSFSINWIALPQ